MDGKRVEKTLTGFVNQIGATDVLYRDNIIKIENVSATSTSVKVLVKAQRRYLEEKDWNELGKITDRKSWQTYLGPHKLHLCGLLELQMSG